MKRELLKKFKRLDEKGNDLKDIIQPHAIDEWLNNTDAMGYLEMFTGMGKTTTALLACKRFFAKYDGVIGVLVPTTKLLKQWNKKIKEWNLSNIEVYVLNSYTMQLGNVNIKRKFDILIGDELHRICNEQSKYFSQALNMTEFDMFLGLSATLDKSHKTFLAKYGIFSAFEITLEEGLELGLVPPFDIYNLACELTEEEEAVYDKWNGLYQCKSAYFGAIASHDAFTLCMACTKVKGFSRVKIDDVVIKKSNMEWIEYVANYYNVSYKEVTETANICRNAMTSRNKCLQEVQSKFDNTVTILNDVFKYKKAIAFVETTAQADNIASLTLGKAIHSKVKENLKEAYLEVFETDEYNDLVQEDVDQIITVKALDEGYDSEELEGAVAKHYTSVSRSFRQRLGRTLRYSIRNPDKHPVYISLYSISKSNKDKIFQDKIQLLSAQKGMIGVKYIKSIEEIKL